MALSATHRSDWVRLADGRRLAFCETGPRDGEAVVYCHGAIGTPLTSSIDLAAITIDLGVRHIAVSRPGVGGSDPSPGRTVLDFATDVRELVDAIGVRRFAVVGVSAGGPYALALGHELADRITRIAICSSLSPLCAPHRTPGMQRRIRLGLQLLTGAPGFCAALGDAVLPAIRSHPELLSHVIAAHAAPSERERLRHPGERAAASRSFLDAAGPGGVRGMIDDFLTYSQPWGFSAGDVESEVHLWHGLNDLLVPIDHALALAATLPHCRAFFDHEEGHHFFRRRLASILATLVGRDAPYRLKVA